MALIKKLYELSNLKEGIKEKIMLENNNNKLQEMNKFKYIKDSVNEILNNINKNDFQGDPINWADLKCSDVELITKEDMSNVWRAYIDEASSDCHYFRTWVKNELFAKYGVQADIITEW